LAKQARIDVEAAREAGRQEHVAPAATVASLASPTPVATPVVTLAASPAPRPNIRKRTSTRCMFISTLASPSLLVDVVASLKQLKLVLLVVLLA
jgi:hypothetical protein